MNPVKTCLLILSLNVVNVLGGLLTYGVCQSGCNVAWGSCYAGLYIIIFSFQFLAPYLSLFANVFIDCE